MAAGEEGLHHLMRTITITISFWKDAMQFKILSALLFAAALFGGGAAAWGEDAEVQLAIRDDQFVPSEITVPAHTKIKLIVDNQDATAEEFESYELNREKVVAAKSKITVYVGPLEPGRYPFFGDFHKDSANGVLIAK
jgi:plastocyanin